MQKIILNSLASVIHKNTPNTTGNSEKVVHRCSGVASPKFFGEAKNLRKQKFDFRLATDYVWDTALQSTKWLDILKFWGGMAHWSPLATPMHSGVRSIKCGLTQQWEGHPWQMDRVFQSSFLKLSDHRSLRGKENTTATAEVILAVKTLKAGKAVGCGSDEYRPKLHNSKPWIEEFFGWLACVRRPADDLSCLKTICPASIFSAGPSTEL